MKNRDNNLIAGLDIGSSKIVVAIAENDEHGNLSILGIGKSESRGSIRGGEIVNIDSMVSCISQAIEDAEIQAGREINGLFVGISSSSVESINSKGVVAISSSDREIKDADVSRVIEAAKAVAIPMDREMLHIVPQGFIVDGKRNIKYPIGMVGTRLECQIHILTVQISAIKNIIKCFERIGIEIYDIVLQNLASSKAVLDDEEKEIGVAMIDMGAETTKISVYSQGSPFYNNIYPLGGYLVTNDIAAGLKISMIQAENIKINNGVAHNEYVGRNETVQIPSMGGRKPRLIARENLIHIIRPRVEEMFFMIKEDLRMKGFAEMIHGGIVLTGGSSLLPGIGEICQEVFDIQTRIGIPKKLHGLHDQIETGEYSSINGILNWADEKVNRQDTVKTGKTREEKQRGIFVTFKKLFDELF